MRFLGGGFRSTVQGFWLGRFGPSGAAVRFAEGESMRASRLTLTLAVAFLFSVALPAAELPDGFRLEPVLGGLTEPSALALTPDGDILITERTTGNLRLVAKGELQTAAACSVSVDATGEGGLVGVAVHPKYPSPAWAYLYYTDSGTGVNRVVRYTLGPGGCTSPTVIVADLGSGGSGLENGGGMTFGPDGKLYVATGSVESAANGQNPLVQEGKVLRLEPDGSIPVDNPTPGSPVFAVGVRDGRGVAAHASGQIYMSDHGDDATSVADEIHPVAAGGNLGWAIESGSGGSLDQPMASWDPPVGLHGLALFPGGALPDLAADGRDSDHDAFGADRHPGVARVDDNAAGICMGSVNNGDQCTTDADCPPRAGGEFVFCELRDDLAEYCPSGTAAGDDVCGNTGAAGVDEPDESYLNSLFAGSDLGIQRAVPVPGSLDQGASWGKFLDASGLGTLPDDCPTGWTGVAVGRDGHLYALATNGGGAAGALYRVVHEGAAGPREVSAPGSPFPVRIARGPSSSEVVVTWEDLREDARQPKDDGVNALPPARTYTVWRGTMGSYTGHTIVSGFSSITGTTVNDALRQTTVPVTAGTSQYFLVSGIGDNIRGTLGNGASGPRPGLGAVIDLCVPTGYHQAPTWSLWKCGQDFTLVDEHNHTRSLSEFRGRVVLLDFSAWWCGPCHSEADVLESLYQAYKDRGVEILTLMMDEEVVGPDWNGRPNYQDCVNWADRSGANPDHTFECWADPPTCTTDPCGAGTTQEGWPRYDAWNALPTNVVLDQAHRVVYTAAGYSAAAISQRFNALVGATDSCLH